METDFVVEPTKARLEASTACQLRCPACPTTRGDVGRHLGTGLLKPADFAEFLKLNPGLQAVELSNYGEVFLNPDLVELLRLAYEREVRITLSNGVNMNRVSAEALEALVRYQVHHITCSIDGATQDVYAKYRVGGDLDSVLANLERLLEIRRRLKSDKPYLTWQFVLFEHNRHELERARALASELDMKFVTKSDWRAPKAESNHTFTFHSPCLQLWESPQINWDGRLLGCCVNCWQGFGGNAFESSLSELVNQEPVKYARKMLVGEAEARPEIPCTRCGRYKTMVESGDYVRPQQDPS